MLKRSIPIHYAWLICAGGTLLLFCTGGLSLTAFAAYLPYLKSLRGLTDAQVSAFVFIRSLTGVAAMLLVNRTLRHWEIRRVITAALVGCGLSFVLYGSVESFPGYCSAAALAGISYGLGSMIAVSILIIRWFNTHRGMALGICMSATGVSTFLVSPVITFLVENLSLQAAFYVEAVFIFLAAAVVWLLVRSLPSCLGMEPLGAGETGSGQATALYARHTAARPLYLCMAFGLLLLGAAANNISSYLSVLYQSVGFSSYQISTVISLFGISLAIGKFAYGELADHIGVFRACLVLYAVALAGSGLCCLAQVSGYVLACLASALVGFGMALASVATSTYAAEVAAEADYSRVVSAFQTTQTFGGLAFTAIPGLLAGWSGNYVSAYIIMFLLILASAVVLQTAYCVIKRRDRD